MSAPNLDVAAQEVIRRFSFIRPRDLLQPLGNRGGFSGARLWRIESKRGPCCLKAWPPGGLERERLEWIHGLMGQARFHGLTFVPEVIATVDHGTSVEHDGRL